ncbi:MAG TPA: ankyrin repeat domain-containing protein [Bryobacteraceae bacterium]|nr:ankyrin repeat domain-containing protein [Bryobacteraceae bacterium]
MRALLSIAGTVILLSASHPAAAADPVSLLEAVRTGNLPAVQTALQQRKDVNQTQPDGTTPLHWAVEQDRLDIVNALLSAGANVNAENRYGVTPLVLAVTTGDASVVGALLKAGADVRVKVAETGSVLAAAARTGNPEVIKLLLAAGADVNFAEHFTGQTALMWAAAQGHPDAVQALLAGGAKVDAQADGQKTALFFAVRRGDIDSVRALIAAGANVNARTAPVDMPNCEICKQYAPGTKFSPFGDSMLVIAILNANFDVADLLLNKGADPNAAGTHWSPLHALIRIRNYEETQFPAPKGTGTLDSLEFAKHLLAHGANPSARAQGYTTQRSSGDQNYLEFKGATPFFLAAKAADLPMLHLLLAAKADYTTPTENHTTPLMVAAGVGCVTGQWIEPEHDVLQTVKILVEDLHADINAQSDAHETALHGAACRAADSVVQYLADKGAKLDVKNADGMTPLDLVVEGIAKPVQISGVPIEKIGYSDHTAALLKKLMADEHYSKSAALR